MSATIAYNGVDLDTAPYSIESVEGLIGGDDLRSHDLLYVDRSGVIPGRDLKGGKTIVLTVNVVADDDAEFNTAVMALQAAFAYPADTELPLTFTLPGMADETAVQINARPRRMAIPYQTGWQTGRYVQAVVELFASDGAKYSASESSTTIGLAAVVGGFVFPVVFPLVFGGGTLGIATVTNAGNIPTAPRFRIDGPVTNPEIRSETAEREIALDLDVAGGDYLIIDTATRSVLLNGTASRYSSLTAAEWFDLQPGANEIRFTGTSAATPTATITYRSAWL
jgi:hypothetical protein